MRALLVGCGSKWGKVFSETLISQGWSVTVVSSSEPLPNCETVKIDWETVNDVAVSSMCKLLDTEAWDLVFFNQVQHGGPDEQSFGPRGSLGDFSRWSRTTWINTWLPMLMIKNLTTSCTDKTRVGWMMTGMVGNKDDANIAKYPLYAAGKFTNHCVMKAFSANHPSTFFTINPSWFPPGEEQKDAEQILRVISAITADQSGQSWNKDGSQW